MSRLNSLDDLNNFPYTLAPMVGLTHAAFRQLVQEYFPTNLYTIWPTEMMNSRRIEVQNLDETPESFITPEEKKGNQFLSPQILANEERFIKASVVKLKNWGAKSIDLNMGCPVKKALKHNYGVALMGDPHYAAEIVKIAARHTNLPISVKLRAGLEKNDGRLLQVVESLEKAGVGWICLHPRFAEQKRRGNCDWSQIKQLKESFSLPIIGNGDIQTAEDALRMREETKCDMAMIGRSITARPWLFWQIAEKKGYRESPPKHKTLPLNPYEEAKEYGRALQRFVELCYEYFTPEDARKRILFYIRVSHPWLNFGHQLNSLAFKAKTKEELIEKLEGFFLSDNLYLSPYSELRY